MSKLQPVYCISSIQIYLLFTKQILQIKRARILKYDISNPVSLVTRHLDFETLYHCFGHASNEVMHYILNNVEDIKKIHFPTQKHVCYSCTFGKIY